MELNRLQNIVISLDKAKYCLGQPGQARGPPLLLMSDADVAEYLWNGERSVARRAARAAAAAMLAQQVGGLLALRLLHYFAGDCVLATAAPNHPAAVSCCCHACCALGGFCASD